MFAPSVGQTSLRSDSISKVDKNPLIYSKLFSRFGLELHRPRFKSFEVTRLDQSNLSSSFIWKLSETSLKKFWISFLEERLLWNYQYDLVGFFLGWIEKPSLAKFGSINLVWSSGPTWKEIYLTHFHLLSRTENESINAQSAYNLSVLLYATACNSTGRFYGVLKLAGKRSISDKFICQE